MSLFPKAAGLYARYGKSIRFGVRLLLGSLLPGSPAVIDLIGQVLEAAEDGDRERQPPPATAEDLQRAEAMLDLLASDLKVLLGQVATLEDLPQAAERVLTVALQMDDRLQDVLGRLDTLAQSFDRLENQNRQVLATCQADSGKLDDILELLKSQNSALRDFTAELRSVGLAPGEFLALVQSFRQESALLSEGHAPQARKVFVDLALACPRSPSVAVALAGAEAANQDLPAAERQLARATRLAPRSAKILDLHRRMTTLNAVSAPYGTGLAPLPTLDVAALLRKRLNQFGGPHLAVEPLLERQALTSEVDFTDTYALLTLIPIVSEAERRRSLNLGLLMDVSVSMYKEDGTGISRLKRIQDAAIAGIGKLRPDDTISIVAFAHNAQVVLPPTRLTEKDKIADVIDKVDLFDVDPGGTAMDLGIGLVMGEVEQYQCAGNLTQLVVLTSGETSDEHACRQLAEQAGQKHIRFDIIGVGTE